MSVILVNASAGQIPLVDGVAHCVVTSPPYWGLRDYGLPPLIWDGDPDCRHVWGDDLIQRQRGQVGSNSTLDGGLQASGDGRIQEANQGQFCQHCRAWRGCLGLEPSIDLYVSHMVQVFKEVRRVLHPTGTVWINLGDSYAGGGRGGNGPKRSKNWQPEYGHPNWRVLDLKPKDLCMIPARVALALQADGWWLRSQIIWHKPNCMPESVTDRPTTSHEYVFLLAKSDRYFYDIDAIREQPITKDIAFAEDLRGESWHDHQDDLGKGQRQLQSTRKKAVPKGGRNKRTVWTIPTHPFSGAHFATFPPALIEPMIKAGCPTRCCPECGSGWAAQIEKESGIAPSEVRGYQADVNSASPNITHGQGSTHAVMFPNSMQLAPRDGVESNILGYHPTCACHAGNPNPPHAPGLVLDPFFGSGTTGIVARELGVDCIGLDLSYDYLKDQARARLELDAWDAWHQGRDGDVVADLEGLPLFEGVG